MAECTGEILGGLIPSEITITQGATANDLVLDLGEGVTINGTIDSDGSITVPSQDVGFGFDMLTVSVSGNGQLDSENSATINVNFSAAFVLNDDCVLTLTM